MSDPETAGNQINSVLFFRKQKFLSISQKTSSLGRFIGVTGTIFYLLSEGDDCIYEIEILVDKDMGWQSLTKGTATKDKMKAIDVDYFIPQARIKVTPKSTDSIFTAKAFGYPAVYIRGPGDPSL